ncbi:hypothetical protein F957_03742 [Acinetobacter gyllenbergii CIP 110306 = MTCC 11365]|uniref:Uncharacterized protein n=1 Tax=Acinetobacter gyllenbergii CIP 110306 = MTCC 11365 TaxID=1217657 RepID=A0A829HEJ0_9GAMM|nr:hypothetical protein F957_03742 [Acinetobacter gyllenbergii CIP 110306 = MTCC 11365]ESK54062.1 hypothetical protein F987_00859 [Acinetobacter gyllenbergii NIPH 230]
MRVFIGLYFIWLTMYVYADKNILICKPESTVFNDILNCYLIE